MLFLRQNGEDNFFLAYTINRSYCYVFQYITPFSPQEKSIFRAVCLPNVMNFRELFTIAHVFSFLRSPVFERLAEGRNLSKHFKLAWSTANLGPLSQHDFS